MSKISINEFFGPTIQGEGRYTGTPSVFVRLNGCNLRCAFKGSICDTPYTSHCPEKAKVYDTEELARRVVNLIEKIGGDCENSHIVITGGEPLLQQEELIDLLVALRDDEDCYNMVTIETNGTIIPDESFRPFGIFWSVSPKLSTSCCFDGTEVPEKMREMHKNCRINLEALSSIVMSGDDYQLKFVYSGPESVTEIKEIIESIKKNVRASLQKDYAKDIIELRLSQIDQRVMLMPEGTTNEQLSQSAPGTVQACIENGWIFCDRAHIRIWGDKRAV